MIDGMHIPAVVNKNIERFRNKKGTLSQNVLAACSFDMIFLYVVVGWEGSASDMRVLNWAIKDGGFTVPNGRYYLADSGFANTLNFLTPYKNHPYHVVKFNRQTRVSRYAVPEALYNHRHAQVRNVIERTFGVLKMRFKILERMPSSLGFRKQTLVVMACCIIHNFIKMQNAPDRFFDASVNMEFTHDNAESVDSWELPSATDIAAGDVIRDNIKNALWRQSRQRN